METNETPSTNFFTRRVKLRPWLSRTLIILWLLRVVMFALGHLGLTILVTLGLAVAYKMSPQFRDWSKSLKVKYKEWIEAGYTLGWPRVIVFILGLGAISLVLKLIWVVIL